MFKLNEIYEVDRSFPKCNFIRYSPAELSTVNIPNTQLYINIPIKKADDSRYVNGIDIRLIFLGPIALFSFLNCQKVVESIWKILVMLISFL